MEITTLQCNPMAIRLYEICRARFTGFLIVSIFVLFAVLAMQTCVSDGEEPSGLLFNKRRGGILQFTLTVFVFVVLNLYRSRIASVCAASPSIVCVIVFCRKFIVLRFLTGAVLQGDVLGGYLVITKQGSFIPGPVTSFAGFLLRIFRVSFEDFQGFFLGFSGFLLGIFRVSFRDFQDTLCEKERERERVSVSWKT